MDKQISIKIWIVIAAVSVVIVILSIWIALAPPGKPPTDTGIIVPNTPKSSAQNQFPESVGDEKQKACLASGGTASTALCCGQTQDFSNNCATGACGCAPTSSHEVKICKCGQGKCFDGNSCVDAKSPTAPTASPGSKKDESAGWKTYVNTDYNFEMEYPFNWLLSVENIQPSIKSVYITLTSPKTKSMEDQQGEYPAGDLFVTAYQSLKDFNSGENYQTKNLQESLNKMKDSGIIEAIKETSVNGMKAFETNQLGMGSGDYTLYIEKNDGKIYELDFSLMASRKDFSPVENRILSSFKPI